MKILLVHQHKSSFVEQDFDILRETHEVRECVFPGHRRGLFRLFKDIFLLFRGVLWCDVTYSWFGKLHAFFAVLFSKIMGKKSVVVSGGDDVAGSSDGYQGMISHWWKRWCPLFVFKYADLILCVSEFNHGETLENARADEHKTFLIRLGFELDKFRRMPDVDKEDIVITVAHVHRNHFLGKGLKLFVETAWLLPQRQFILVGPWLDDTIDDLKQAAPPNVTFTGGLYGDDLLKMYNKARVYVQASIYESFGCTVAESMLCECVPVATRRAALPEVIGDSGIYVENLEADHLARAIEQAMDSNLGPEAHDRIAAVFPMEKRRNELLAVLEVLVN